MFGEVVNVNPTGEGEAAPLRATTHPELGVVVAANEVTALIGMALATTGLQVLMTPAGQTDDGNKVSEAFRATTTVLVDGMKALMLEVDPTLLDRLED